MDDKWRVKSCDICRGGGVVWLGEDVGGCRTCNEAGRVYLRPKGHAFEYPGGPAVGWWSEQDYEEASPVMPWSWHFLKNFDYENAPIDPRTGDPIGTQAVECECGWVGTFDAHELHCTQKELEFIAERKPDDPRVHIIGTTPLTSFGASGIIVGTFSV